MTIERRETIVQLVHVCEVDEESTFGLLKRAQQLFPIVGIAFAIIVNAAWICLSWVFVAALDGTFSRVNALKLVRLRADPGKPSNWCAISMSV